MHPTQGIKQLPLYYSFCRSHQKQCDTQHIPNTPKLKQVILPRPESTRCENTPNDPR